MTTQLIQAAQQAIEALQGGTGNTHSWHLAIEDAIIALRTAIHQAESEPLTATFVQTVPDKCDRILWRGRYLHLPIRNPAPGVPDDVVRDAERYRWLRKSLPAGQGSLTVLLDDRCNGAFHKAVFMESLDASIDAAMLTTSPAQKDES